MLKKYCTVPERQIETPVVLVDKKWRNTNNKESPFSFGANFPRASRLN
jgi:hypothetical protein